MHNIIYTIYLHYCFWNVSNCFWNIYYHCHSIIAIFNLCSVHHNLFAFHYAFIISHLAPLQIHKEHHFIIFLINNHNNHSVPDRTIQKMIPIEFEQSWEWFRSSSNNPENDSDPVRTILYKIHSPKNIAIFCFWTTVSGLFYKNFWPPNNILLDIAKHFFYL